MSDNPILTISLLSSGRIETIERCLSSLVPFKEQLDTEIIVVDTDPEHREDVHAILEKYADQIIPFVWCDDFSAARNVGVDAAHGEWFMFIDDDEWFIDAQPIIDFLQSEEESHYHWANHRLRDYFDDAHDKSQNAWVSRLFRMDGKTRFIYRVHECFSPIRGKEKNLNALLGHDGYNYHSREEKLAHAKRNMDLIFKMMEEEPKQVRWVYQIIMEYQLLADAEKIREMSMKGYRMMGDAKGYRNACLRGLFASSLVKVEKDTKNYDAALDAYKRFKRDRKSFGRVSTAFMESETAQAAFNLDKTKEAKRHCRAYLKIYEALKDKPVEHTEDYINYLADTFEERRWAVVTALLMYLDISDGDWTSYEEYFHEFKWDGSAEYSFPGYEIRFIEAACRTEYDVHFSEMVAVFWYFHEARKVLQQELLKMEKARDDRKWKLIRALAEADIKEEIPWDLKIMWADHNGERSNMKEYFRGLFTAINPLLAASELWRIGLRRGAVLDERIGEIPMEGWRICVDRFCEKADTAHIEEMAGILDEVYMGMPDERYAYFKSCADVKLVQVAKEVAKTSEISRQEEMASIIATLEGKVKELIAAGMINEAEQVMEQIRRYAP